MRGARIFWVSATGLSKEPSLRAHRAALAARGRREHTIIDLDYRAMFWPDEATAHEAVRAVLPDTTIAIGNREECRVAVGQTEPERTADALLEAGVELAIVKQGPQFSFCWASPWTRGPYACCSNRA